MAEVGDIRPTCYVNEEGIKKKVGKKNVISASVDVGHRNIQKKEKKRREKITMLK